MYAPATFAAAVGLMLLSMLCWGSWANALSLCRKKYRFELFYWDYAVGVLAGAALLSVALGSESMLFRGGLVVSKVAWAIVAGAVFNIGNVLLVASIRIAGMAVAFPVCIGLALLIGVGLSWAIEPTVPAVPMAVGCLLILGSMLMDAAAYRAKATQTEASPRGLIIAILGGLFMGAFPPCLQKAMVGSAPLDPYAASTLLAVGVLACAVATNYFFMRWPIAGGEAVGFREFFRAPIRYHGLGLLGGMIWASGAVFNFIASGQVGVAVGYAFGTGATLVAAIWGIFVWQEFRGAPRRTYYYLSGMFLLFLAGIAVIGYAKSTMSGT